LRIRLSFMDPFLLRSYCVNCRAQQCRFSKHYMEIGRIRSRLIIVSSVGSY
jgi:peroxiredoxin